MTLEEARAKKVSRLKVEIDTCNLCDGFIDELAEILQPFRPRDTVGCPVAVRIVNKMSQGDVILGDDWRVILHDDLLQNLKEHYGSEKVHLQYA
jgi:DNA polymerase-3 subunit alpha